MDGRATYNKPVGTGQQRRFQKLGAAEPGPFRAPMASRPPTNSWFGVPRDQHRSERSSKPRIRRCRGSCRRRRRASEKDGQIRPEAPAKLCEIGVAMRGCRSTIVSPRSSGGCLRTTPGHFSSLLKSKFPSRSPRWRTMMSAEPFQAERRNSTSRREAFICAVGEAGPA